MKKRKAVKKTAAKKQGKKRTAKTKRAVSSPAKRRKATGTNRKKARGTSKAKSTRAKMARKKPASGTTKQRGGRSAGRGPAADPREFSRGEVASNRAGQSGDIQGLSNRAGADSESVEELLDEGNAFEADAVEGVERAGNSTREVRTRQVPDDVPGEYLDED